MAEQEQQQPSRRELSPDVLRRLDGGLRRLLQMTDEEIVRAVDEHEARLAERRAEINRLAVLPPRATEEDRAAVRRTQRLLRAQIRPHPLFDLLVIDRVRPVRIRARAIVHFTGSRDDLVALGLEVRAQAQDIFTVTGTLDQLTALAAQPATQRMRLPRLLLPAVEEAAAQAEIDAVHQPRPINPTGFQGQNVIVGLIDSPIDVTHHGFRDPAAPHDPPQDTRLLYYWVQDPYTLDASGTPVPQANPPGQTPHDFHAANPGGTPNFTGLTYGRIYTAQQINTAIGLASPYGAGANQICAQPDDSEHGTHTAGIASGSGHVNNWATAPVHVGAAPQATMIHVTPRWDSAFEDAVIDAIDFILRAAQFHNLPVVVSASLGTNLGPHNGASQFDQARDNLLNSFFNRSIVWAAGNDNDANGFRKGTIAPGATETLTVSPVMLDWFDTPVARSLDVWYAGPVPQYEVQCGGAASGWQAATQDYTGTLNGFTVNVDGDPESGGDLHGIRFDFLAAVSTALWTVRLRNTHASDPVQYYAWTGVQSWLAAINGPIHDEFTIGDTGCGRSILTVGACQKRHPPAPAAGEAITGYSGAGPTVDRRIKPEIVAGGGTDPDQIISARSDQASGYIGMYGTSMAAPLVAGAVALLFEEYHALGHDLNQDTVKALLTQNANRLNLHLDPGQPGYVAKERNLYGYGRLRMIAPIDQILPPLNVDVWVRTADDDYGLQPYPGDTFWTAPDIRVFEAGTTNETYQLTWGHDYDVHVTARNLGDDNAVGTTVRLKYTLPWTAPNAWHAAEDAANHAQEQTVTIHALSQQVVTFHWRPEAAEVGAPAGTTHFCLLAEVDHPLDRLNFPAPTAPGGDAWATNIKGVNNVALRNVHIQ